MSHQRPTGNPAPDPQGLPSHDPLDDRLHAYLSARAALDVPEDLLASLRRPARPRRWGFSRPLGARLGLLGSVAVVIVVVALLVASFPFGNGGPTPVPASGTSSRPPFDSELASAGFPSIVLGIPVLSVAQARVLIADGAHGGRAMAVGGWWSQATQQMGCPRPMQFQSPVQGYCSLTALAPTDAVIDDYQHSGNGSSEGFNPPGDAILGRLVAETAGSDVPWSGVSMDDPRRQQPQRVVVIGHVGDPRAWMCAPETIASCRKEFVIDAFAWVEGQSVDAFNDRGGPPASLTRDQARTIIAPAGTLVTFSPWPVDEGTDLDPRIGPDWPGSGEFWLARVIAGPPDSQGTAPLLEVLVDDATAAARTLPMAVAPGTEPASVQFTATGDFFQQNGQLPSLYAAVIDGETGSKRAAQTYLQPLWNTPAVLGAGTYRVISWSGDPNSTDPAPSPPPRVPCGARLDVASGDLVTVTITWAGDGSCTMDVTGAEPAPTPLVEPSTAPPPSSSAGESPSAFTLAPELAAAGFPSTVLGLPVLSVGEAQALIDSGTEDGRAMAIGGWWSAPGGAWSCPVAFSGPPIDTYCPPPPVLAPADATYTERPPAGSIATYVVPETAGRNLIRSGSPAQRVVVVAHVGDVRKLQCINNTVEACSRELVVDSFAWVEDKVPDALAQGSGGLNLTPDQAGSAIEAADPGGYVVSFLPLATSAEAVDPRVTLDGGPVWIGRAVIGPPDAGGTGELDEVVVSDATSVAQVLPMAIPPGSEPAVARFRLSGTNDNPWVAVVSGDVTVVQRLLNAGTRNMPAVLEAGDYRVDAWNPYERPVGAAPTVPPDPACSAPLDVSSGDLVTVSIAWASDGTCTMSLVEAAPTPAPTVAPSPSSVGWTTLASSDTAGASWSPDGRWLLAWDVVTNGSEAHLGLFDASGQLVRSLPPRSAAWLDDGSFLLFGAGAVQEGTVDGSDLVTVSGLPVPTGTVPLSNGHGAVAINSGTRDASETYRTWTAARLGNATPGEAETWSPDGGELAVWHFATPGEGTGGQPTGWLEVLGWPGLQRLATVRGQAVDWSEVTFDGSGRFVAFSGPGEGPIGILDVRSDKTVSLGAARSGPFAWFGDELLVASADRTVSAFGADGALLDQYAGLGDEVVGAPDGSSAAAWNSDGGTTASLFRDTSIDQVSLPDQLWGTLELSAGGGLVDVAWTQGGQKVMLHR
jgi:hypothetical protein